MSQRESEFKDWLDANRTIVYVAAVLLLGGGVALSLLPHPEEPSGKAADGASSTFPTDEEKLARLQRREPDPRYAPQSAQAPPASPRPRGGLLASMKRRLQAAFRRWSGSK